MVFQAFVDAVESQVRQVREPAEVVKRIEPCVRALISQRDWLQPAHRQPINGKPYAQYLLHRPNDHAFSIVSFVWNPGQGSPIHDHCTWGVIGQYEGEEEEIRFRVGDNTLETISVIQSRPGDVSHVYPPNRDVHQILNRSASPTISIHVYGGDIGSQPRHVYDRLSGECRAFVSGYDSPVR